VTDSRDRAGRLADGRGDGVTPALLPQPGGLEGVLGVEIGVDVVELPIPDPADITPAVVVADMAGSGFTPEPKDHHHAVLAEVEKFLHFDLGAFPMTSMTSAKRSMSADAPKAERASGHFL
jgi:hypothetical protein